MNRFVITLLFIAFSLSPAYSQQALRQKHFNLDKNIAISGYDPVSYFLGTPRKGSPTYAYTLEGITYHFYSAQNLAIFKQRPTNYEPQYGGWCAYAMGSSGEKVSIDPETYKIVGGKLYLFYNKYFTNTLTSWNKDEKSLKAKADSNWIKLFK
jgi:YHS domain-containing protein